MPDVPLIVKAFRRRFLNPGTLHSTLSPTAAQRTAGPEHREPTKPQSAVQARCRTPIARGARIISAPSTTKAAATAPTTSAAATRRAIPPHLLTTPRQRGTAPRPEPPTDTTGTMMARAVGHTMDGVNFLGLAAEEAVSDKKQQLHEVSEGVVAEELEGSVREAQYHPKASRRLRL